MVSQMNEWSGCNIYMINSGKWTYYNAPKIWVILKQDEDEDEDEDREC